MRDSPFLYGDYLTARFRRPNSLIPIGTRLDASRNKSTGCFAISVTVVPTKDHTSAIAKIIASIIVFLSAI